MQIEDSGGSQVADLTTNASGYYSTELTDGDYTNTVEAPNYETASRDISVSGAAVTTNFSLTPGSGAYAFDYTLGVCYPTNDAEFDASTGKANLLRRYLTDGTHPDSKLPPRPPDGLSGTLRSYNGPAFPTAAFERVAVGKEFNYKNNITATVENPDRSQYTWGLTAEIETDRAYYDLHGIEPSSASRGCSMRSATRW